MCRSPLRSNRSLPSRERLERRVHYLGPKPWTEIDNKENVDIMWECCKSLFVQVLDKHAPLKTKIVRKRGTVPWIDKDVRTELFERDFLKRKGIKTNEQCDWNKYKSARNSANIALSHAKREYYTTKFQNFKTNPKHAWQTINDILGRNNNQSIITEPAARSAAPGVSPGRRLLIPH